jgi:hypothetical protein
MPQQDLRPMWTHAEASPDTYISGLAGRMTPASPSQPDQAKSMVIRRWIKRKTKMFTIIKARRSDHDERDNTN